jgi:TonB-dependent SusC/RagA subfamily outer membrane receptor
LIIVNGRVFNGFLSDIPAGDIVSVSRMDDAAATSLYGSRAANGATIVTTREGTYSIIDTAILEPEGSIEVQEWKRDAEYMKQLEKAAPADFYKTYVGLKEKYKEIPAFYVDAASLLYKRGLKALALQVLSNVAELQLEDAELMRILGHQLQEWNEKQLSLETFEDVKEIRAEHPQSWRDLALAQAEAGKYQEAADGLYHILTHSWDDRFSRLVSVVLSEFNAILGAHPGVNTAAYDKRLIYKMPVDVRIVITWSSDDSDVDLWVKDPMNEQCDYTFALTKGGGRLSGDITQGFGPEEYMMKKAVNGNYVVSINYFGDQRQTLAGPVTVKAEMYTNYGKPNQKKQVINLRLSSKKEVLKIGTLKFTANQ